MEAYGFPTDEFVVHPSHDLICGVCYGVHNNPHQCKNGHCFCLTCVSQALRTRQNCPTCNDPLTVQTLGNNLIVRNIINQLPVKCIKTTIDGDTCDWTGALEERSVHTTTYCPLEIIDCPLFDIQGCDGCTGKLLRRDLTNHVLKLDTVTALVNRIKALKEENVQLKNKEVVGYLGEKQNGEMHGVGLEKVTENDYFVGEYLHGKRTGFGVKRTGNLVYHGQLKNNKRDGFGVLLRLDNGTKYVGEFRDGQYEGQGTLSKSEGSVFTGVFARNCFKAGKMTYINGDTYEGEWINNDWHGIGVLTAANGDVFTGMFSKGIKHGRGRVKSALDGCEQEMVFNRGVELLPLTVKRDASGAVQGEVHEVTLMVLDMFRPTKLNILDMLEVFREKFGIYLLQKLKDKETNFAVEQRVIDCLRQFLGVQVVGKLEGILTDAILMASRTDSFELYCRELGVNFDFEFSVCALTDGFWSIQPQQHGVKFPQEFLAAMHTFAGHYSTATTHRRLQWSVTQGTVVLTSAFGGVLYDIEMGVLQAIVLLAFNSKIGDASNVTNLMDVTSDSSTNEKMEFSLTELQDKTGIEKQLLESIMSSLGKDSQALTKARQVDRDGGSIYLYSLNEDFRSDSLCFALAPLVLFDQQQAKHAKYARQIRMESFIVREMKRWKTLTHKQLVEKVLTYKDAIDPEVGAMDLKKCIEDLIDREYIERSGDNRDMYLYLP